jgi:hypothetical protein
MNIDNDYLWDKSGEPDPEVQQLEEILGTLRYQPRPLSIPGTQAGRNRNFFRDFGPRLAIAATIAMLLVGLGLWLDLQRFERRQQRQPSEVVQTPKAPLDSNPSPAGVPRANEKHAPDLAAAAQPRQKRDDGPNRDRHRLNPATVAKNSTRNEAIKNTQLAVNEREGEAAKDQLMLALRVASAKLSFAQKKTQSTNPRDLIHNQHKTG